MRDFEGWQMTFTEFNNRFEGYMTDHKYCYAYELVEKEHEELTGERRYSGYDSFRTTRNKKKRN